MLAVLRVRRLREARRCADEEYVQAVGKLNTCRRYVRALFVILGSDNLAAKFLDEKCSFHRCTV